MPAVEKKGGLFQKYGKKLDEAVKKHVDDPVEYGPQRLPGGIVNGIARIDKCGFAQVAQGKQNAGEYYLRADAVVISPATVEVNGRPMEVKGLKTSVLEMVCDTRTQAGVVTSCEEHVQTILNIFKQIMGPEFVKGVGGPELEELAAVIQQERPYITFSTSQSAPSKQYPDPRVWENWHRGLADYQEESSEQMEDNTTAATPSANGQGAGSSANSPRHTNRVAQAAPKPESQQEADDAGGDDQQLTDFQIMELAEVADDEKSADKKGARAQLQQLALSAGISKEDIENADNWTAVAQMLSSSDSTDSEQQEEQGAEGAEAAGDEEGEQESAEEQPQEYQPSKGDPIWYKPLMVDQRTKKTVRAKKPKEYAVLTVNTTSKTVTLQDLDTKKTISSGKLDAKKKLIPLAISWDELMQTEEG